MKIEQCGKSLYASEKVREAFHDHEHEIRICIPKTKAKVVVLGNSGVGKTSIIYRHRFANKSTPINTTIGATFVTCDVETPTEDILLQVWDTAGQERFRCMVPMYMRNAAAAIIVYDVTCRNSFNDVDKWISELNRCCGQTEPILVIIGNKADLDTQRQVASGEGFSKAHRYNARFFELSADQPNAFSDVLDKVGHDLAFVGRCSEISEKVPKEDSPLISPVLELKDQSSDETIPSVRRKCCAFV